MTMKKPSNLDNFLDWFIENYFALFWFCIGMAYLISGFVHLLRNEYDRAFALTTFGVACHARAEVKILQTRIEHLESAKADEQ